MMLFWLEEECNKNKFLKSVERMVGVTHKGFRFSDEIYELSEDEMLERGYDLKYITNGVFDWENQDEMIMLARKYLKTINLQNREEYEYDTIEWQLANIKDTVEIDSHLFPICNLKSINGLYEKLFK